MTAPIVTIVIPTYNRAHLLLRAIASVQAQTCADWELIVVDDGSTDSTVANVTAMVAADPRIRLLINTGSRGPAAARNVAMAAARTPWAAFLDSDDSWEPEKLARFMAEAIAHPEAVLVGSDYWMVDRDKGRSETMLAFIHREMIPWWENDPLLSAIIPCAAIKVSPSLLASREVMLATQLGGFLWVHTSSAMVRLEEVRRAGGFDETLAQTEDIRLWLELAERGSVVFIPEPLATYDITGRNIGTGERYSQHETRRRPSLYATRRFHLELMQWLRRHRPLTGAQRRVARRAIISGHRRCAEAARGTRPFAVFLMHRLAGSHRFRALSAYLGF